MESKSKGFPSIKFPSSILREAFDIFFSSTEINKRGPSLKTLTVVSETESQSFNDITRFSLEYDKNIEYADFHYLYGYIERIDAEFQLRYSEGSTNIKIRLEKSRDIVDKIFAVFESYYKRHKPVEKKSQQTKGEPVKKFKDLSYSFWRNPSRVFETMQKMDKAGQFLELQKFKTDLEQFKEEGMSKNERTRFEEEMRKLQTKSAKKISSKPQKAEEVKIFIGHGQNPQWRDLKDFLGEQLKFHVITYESAPREGQNVPDVIDEMWKEATFALLVFTGENEGKDGKLRARDNVIHEMGLFQSKLGSKRAIAVREEGCEIPSNISAKQQLRFPKGIIRTSFGQIVAILKREFHLW